MQVSKVPLSRLHSNRATSVAVLENVTVAVVPVTVTPPIVAAGAVVSMTKVLSTAVPTLPAWSIARTRTVCEPPDRPVNSRGLVHVANAPVSRLHFEPRTSVVLENVTVAVVPLTVTSPIAAGAVHDNALARFHVASSHLSCEPGSLYSRAGTVWKAASALEAWLKFVWYRSVAERPGLTCRRRTRE